MSTTDASRGIHPVGPGSDDSPKEESPSYPSLADVVSGRKRLSRVERVSQALKLAEQADVVMDKLVDDLGHFGVNLHAAQTLALASLALSLAVIAEMRSQEAIR